MPIPFAVGLIPLFLSPVWNLQALNEIFVSERTQIAVDNAAILTGRGERDALNALVRANIRLRALDFAHHALHLCARSQGATAACIVADKTAEQAIVAARQAAIREANLRRTGAYQRALAEFRRLESSLFLQANRPASLFVTGVRCSVCGLDVEWEISALPAYTLSAGDSHTHLTVRGRSLRSPKKWNYQLHDVKS